jgi:hypothetical protein
VTGSDPHDDKSFDSFLAELSGVVGNRIESLQPSLPSAPDPVFYNDAKVIHHWPDLAGFVIEELR